MLRVLPPFRKRVKTTQASARHPRRFRPFCEPLEDRWLLSGLTIDLSGPSAGLVGAPVSWTATSSGYGDNPVYQFSVTPIGGTPQIVRDFSPTNSFVWNPMQEGGFTIQATVKDSYSDTSGDSTTAPYTADTRITGNSAVISSMANPLVALFSAPPTTDPNASSLTVQYSLDPTSWRSTPAQPLVSGQSNNFLVAGLLPNTTYFMRYVLSDGTTSTPLTFTTGSLPSNLTFPTFSVVQPPTAATDPTEDMIYHSELPTEANSVAVLATDLAGNIEWYYDPVANNFNGYAVSLLPGGDMYLMGGSALREIDLAGDPLRETNVNAINAQLAAMGQQPILDFSHDAQLLPNGDTAVIADSQRTILVNGTPTTYVGTMILVLDQNFQVTWVWDAFNWLDTSRLPTDGEGPGDWLHTNAISWSPEDGDLLVSLRAQDWMIKIAYSNGTGDGHVVWRLGQGGDFSLNSSDPTAWFSHQHDARYINDNTIVVFDDGNTRRMSDPNADSRGQEWVINEQTMQATPVVNADMGNYSFALGSAQVLSNGNLDFTSGWLGDAAPYYGQSIEVSPDGTTNYVLQMSGIEYRSYFMSTLYAGANNDYGLLDPGFERPSQGTGASAYQDDPTGSPWSFSGTAGLAGNGSTLTSGNGNAPQGGQVAFVQGSGSVSQVATSLAADGYQISVSAAQGGSNGSNTESVQVLVDGTAVASFTPTSTRYATYTTPLFNLTPGSHTISFAGVDPSGTGSIALLDQVSLAVVLVQIAPGFLSGDSAVFTVGQSGNVIVSATGSPLPSLTASGSLPRGVTFRDNGNGTATLGGTPAAGTMGTYDFTVRAHNGVDSDATQDFTLTVNSVSAPPPPSPSPPSPPALKVPLLLAFFDSLLGGVETVNTNGTETITDSLFGIPPLVSTFDSSGNLLNVTLFGFPIPNWIWFV